MGDSNEPTSWWRTLPGVLTSAATLITAIGGLIVVVHSNKSKEPDKPQAHQREAMVTNQSTVNAIEDATKKADTASSHTTLPHHDSIIHKTMKGNVGKAAVVFSLAFNYTTRKINGHYNYTTIRPNEVYRIDGNILEKNIELHEYASNIETASCRLLELDNKCYEGKMYNKNGRVLDMRLCE